VIFREVKLRWMRNLECFEILKIDMQVCSEKLKGGGEFRETYKWK
jgi:hypothetical protein